MSGSPAATRAPARVARSALTAQLSERLDAAVTPPCPSPNTLSTRALSHGSAHSLARNSLARNSLARNSLPRNSLPRNSPRNMRRQVEARRKNAVARSDPIPIASAAPHPQHAAMSFLSVAASVTSGASLECGESCTTAQAHQS
ncbi:hypothetical protein BC830DRAFT_1174941 [Chytriomyces sp. MP71]|nr:hypothetical protein BC830DRAFT_1174941 [Chytriomyces sp. MP71]